MGHLASPSFEEPSMRSLHRSSLVLVGFGVAAIVASHSCAEPIPDKMQEHVNKGLEWLRKNQNKTDGTWSPGGQNPVAMTSLAGVAMLCECSTVTHGKYRDNIRL